MTWIRTNSGCKYDYLTGEVEGELNFKEDFLVPLSRIPRFNGATRDYITILCHEVVAARVAIAMGEKARLAHLLLNHDNEEAFVGDMPTPLKSAVGRELWDPIAARAQAVVFGLVGIDPPSEDETKFIKWYDGVCLEAERRTQKKGATWKTVEEGEDFETAVRHAIDFYTEALKYHAASGYQAVHAYLELDRDIRREAYWK